MPTLLYRVKFREEELVKKQEEKQKKKEEQLAMAEEKERILDAIRAKVFMHEDRLTDAQIEIITHSSS